MKHDVRVIAECYVPIRFGQLQRVMEQYDRQVGKFFEE